MADWSEPIATTLYTAVLTAIDDRFDDVALMFNGLSPTNLPTGAWRIDGSSSNALQTWNGSSWDDEILTVQRLLILSNDAATETDLLFTGAPNISADGSMRFYIDSNNDQTDRVFEWKKDAAFNTGGSLLMSLSEAGVLLLGTKTVLHSSGGQTIAANFGANAIGFAVEDNNTNAALRMYPDLGAGGINPKSEVDDFGLFFYDSADDLANGIIGVRGTSGAPAIRFDGAAQTIELTAAGDFIIDAELRLLKGFSEDPDSYGLGGSITLDLNDASYFYPTGPLTSVPTFTFTVPATGDRVYSFVMELDNGENFAPLWPGGVKWSDNDTEPTWSAGLDLIGFTTRDNGTSWLGYSAGVDFA